MNNLRSEFEKLPEVAKNIDKYVFCDLENEYKAIDIRYAVGCIKINGAWYAFQEQQEKIEAVKKYLSEINHTDGHAGMAIRDDLWELLK